MPDFYRLDTDASLAELHVNLKSGLSPEEVTQRQQQYGANKLPSGVKVSLLQLIFSQFKNIMVIVLILAAVVSLFLGDVKDVIVILLIVVANAALGTYQEYQAEQALAALSSMQVPQVRVRRQGQVSVVSAQDLVPGDIVLLNEGDRVSADGRLLVSANLQIEEAALTGESQAVFKNVEPIDQEGVGIGDRHNMVFIGTSVTSGRGEMLVTATGLQTELGKIASLLIDVKETKTPLQKRVDHLGVLLVRGAVAVVVIVFIAGVLRGIPVSEMLLTAISLAVAAVPEGLTAVITVALSLGASRMVKRHALIRRLPAVETLGSVTTICSDKTGTLTRNQMTATLLALPGHDDVEITGVGYLPEGQFVERTDNQTTRQINPREDVTVGRFLRAMALATDAYLEKEVDGEVEVVGDTTEGALLVAAQKVGWTREELERELPRVAELPFSSERKAMTTIHAVKDDEIRKHFSDHPYLLITKGAPDRLLEWASGEHMPDGIVPMTAERRQIWQKEIDELAKKGLRVLGAAYRPLDQLPEQVDEKIERDLNLLGLIGILDPARPEAREAVKTARSAGIKTIMITGDHALTAQAIAADLGIVAPSTNAITGNQIEKMSDAQLTETLKIHNVFARVAPEHKLRLVKMLQASGEVVAMTGDGVNDAPALKQADIGVAMGITGTDVSKGAADMVLIDDNFASIVAAVEEGRTIYDNIRKFVLFLLSSNLAEILVMFVGILVGLPVPLLAIQILWVNLITDGLPAIALGFDPTEPGVMKRPPRPQSESIFAHGVGRKIIIRSILLSILTLGAFLYAHIAHNLDPFSSTLGLEKLNAIQLSELVSSTPAGWDSMSETERRTYLQTTAADNHEGESEIVGQADRIPRTIAFTVLALGQIFHVMSIHAGDKRSFFRVWFSENRFMLWAVLSTFILQLAVIYLPFLQYTFETYPVRLPEMIAAVLIASVMLFGAEAEKWIMLRRQSV